MRSPRLFVVVVVVALAGCLQPYGSRHWPRSRESRPLLVFETAADLSSPDHFFDAPWPADARVLPDGAPDIGGLPNPFGVFFVERSKAAVVDGVKANGPGFSPMSVVSFRFDRVPPPFAIVPLTTTNPRSGVQLVDLTPGRAGHRVPIDVHVTAKADSARPAGLLQVAPLSGLSLLPGTWAVIVRRDVDGDGADDLAPSPVVAALLRGMNPDPVWRQTFRPLVEQLHDLRIDVDDVAAATVFSVAEPERLLTERLQALRKGPAPLLKKLERPVDPARVDVNKHDLIELRGVVEQAQHQEGEPPHLFDGGEFVFSKDGGLAVTRVEDAPFVLTIPKGKMPPKGWPLFLYVHGTGGQPTQALDRGRRSRPGVPGVPGTGLSSWIAPLGVATACVAGPYSPDRLGDRALDGYGAYTFTNPAAMRDNFGQMLIEHVRFLRLLDELVIDPALVPEVDAAAAADGKVRFDTSRLLIGGHSLGSYLTGMLAGALDGVDGAVLSGAGGTWVEFAFGPKDPVDLQGLVETFSLPPGEDFDRFHPFIDVFEFAAAAADNTLYTRHILRDPWPGHGAPHVLVIEGQPDAQVPTNLQRALVRSVGVDFVGTDVGVRSIDRLLPGLHAIGREALAGPVVGNVDVKGRGRRTGVVVRYAEDGLLDGHSVLFQRDDARRVFIDFVGAVVAGEVPVIDP
ncbi:MAG: hypothetical protein Q8O67_06400 [Deltaproteobacteria bacterium]|nr:hypothetical protein [Deltaproteobacteria bacterium]